MAKIIGSTFSDELKAVGLGDGLAFTVGGTDEDIQGRSSLSANASAALDAVIAAHDYLVGKRADAVAAIKAEAYRRIVLVLPEWKQRNLTARAAELAMLRQVNGVLTVDEQTEWEAGAQLWARIKHIRDISGVLEQTVGGMDAASLDAFNAADDALWL